MTLLPEVRDELRAAAERRIAVGGADAGDAAGSRRRLPVRRPRIGHRLLLAIGVVCPLLVVAVVVIAGGQRQAGPVAARAAQGTDALTERLAVLRRPQTAADRTLPARYLTARGLVLDRKLVRLIAVVPAHRLGTVRVYLIVQLVTRPGAQSFTRADRRGTALASLFAVTSRGDNGHAGFAGTEPVAAGQLKDPLQPLLGVGPSNLLVGLVPDDVSRVELVYSGAGFGVAHPRQTVVDSSPRNNVFVVTSRAVDGPLLRARWYGAGGRVIASVGGGREAAQQLALIKTVNASRRLPIAPSLVAHFALFRTVPPTTPVQDSRMPFNGAYGGPVGAMRLNYWQTRYVGAVTGLGGGLWVTPGARGVCVYTPTGGWCSPLTRRSDPDGGGWSGGSSIGSAEQTINGLVPDGNRTVTLVLASGAQIRVPVTDNVYEATVHGRVVAIVDRNAAGQVVRHTHG
jgi:hypothetical protein